jgi:pyruvate,water dikinase
MRDDESPTNRFAARVKSFEDAKRQALRTAKPVARLGLRVLLRLARRYTELREQGKTLMLQCLDVARAAGRVLGRELARAGTIDDADDVFFLTLAEIEDALTTERNLRELVADRRRLHHAYQGITLPLAFRGEDLETIVDGHRTAGPAPTAPAVDAVEGLGVSPGTAVGVARVITDPLECADFEPGHVLVCTTTDPGWAPLLSLAAGVVLDMGSMLSHGAIVARELGVPCVANTTDGTRTIPDGALVEVDGTNGVVRVLEHLPQPATGGAA